MRIKTGLLVLGLAMIVLVIGCSDSDENSPTDSSQTITQAIYEGELWLDIEPTIVGRQTVDTVRLVIDHADYNMTMLTNRPGLCDMAGTVSGFGLREATFDPTTVLTLDCDSLHVLKGKYPTRFKGDSLVMIRLDVALDTDFVFRLLRLPPAPSPAAGRSRHQNSPIIAAICGFRGALLLPPLW